MHEPSCPANKEVNMFIKKIIDNLEKSFWFIPALFAIFPFVIFYSVFKYAIPDNNLYNQYSFFFHIVANPDTAKLILGAIAGAVISIISISFSITVVVLSIASQQYSPRLLQNFMRQNDTKIILGIFISTFIYCLITMGLTHENVVFEGVFTILAFIGFLLGILSLLAFIYFINYVIQTISLTNIVSNIEEDIVTTFKKFYPPMSELTESVVDVDTINLSCDFVVFASETGYLQSINYSNLINTANNHDCSFKILHHVGEYVIENTALLEIHYHKTALTDEMIKTLSNQFTFHNERKIDEDILFPISQMVDIAVRALSPGINDPRTAINCIDVLAKTLSFLSGRTIMSAVIIKDKKLCVVRPTYTYKDLVKASYRTIYDNAKNNRLVLSHLVHVISNLIKIPANKNFKEALIFEANIIRLHNNLNSFDNKEIAMLYTKLDIPLLEEQNVNL